MSRVQRGVHSTRARALLVSRVVRILGRLLLTPVAGVLDSVAQILKTIRDVAGSSKFYHGTKLQRGSVPAMPAQSVTRMVWYARCRSLKGLRLEWLKPTAKILLGRAAFVHAERRHAAAFSRRMSAIKSASAGSAASAITLSRRDSLDIWPPMSAMCRATAISMRGGLPQVSAQRRARVPRRCSARARSRATARGTVRCLGVDRAWRNRM